MRVLLTTSSLKPHHGGPAVSVPRLAASLAKRGIDVTLWVADGSKDETSMSQPTAIKHAVGSLSNVFKTGRDFDLIHDNGIWQPHHRTLARITRRRGIARIVSPRGMLEPWALNHKRMKKKAAWFAYQRRDLETADALIATSKAEAKHLADLNLTAPVHMVPNGMDVPTSRLSRTPHSSGKHALFLSRIHPKKGLPMLVKAWATLRPKDWSLTLAGPDENGHRGEVEDMICRHGLKHQISLTGPCYGTDKTRLFNRSDLFILPTHSENFGMAIAEALAHELPVLTTTAAPWSDLAVHQCGWWVDPNQDAVCDGLRRALNTPVEELQAMGARGRRLIAETYDWDGIAERMIATYGHVLTTITMKSRAA